MKIHNSIFLYFYKKKQGISIETLSLFFYTWNLLQTGRNVSNEKKSLFLKYI